MITTGLVLLIYGLVYSLSLPFLLLADVSLDSGIAAALTQAGSYISMVDAFFPIGVLLATFAGVHLIVEGYIFSYKLVMWVIRKIPGVS